MSACRRGSVVLKKKKELQEESYFMDEVHLHKVLFLLIYLQLSSQFPENYSSVMRDFRLNNEGVNECSMYVAVPTICYMFILGVSTRTELVL